MNEREIKIGAAIWFAFLMLPYGSEAEAPAHAAWMAWRRLATPQEVEAARERAAMEFMQHD